MKSGCGGRGRIALPIPHSRLPIPKGGVAWGGRFPTVGGGRVALPLAQVNGHGLEHRVRRRAGCKAELPR